MTTGPANKGLVTDAWVRCARPRAAQPQGVGQAETGAKPAPVFPLFPWPPGSAGRPFPRTSPWRPTLQLGKLNVWDLFQPATKTAHFCRRSRFPSGRASG